MAASSYSAPMQGMCTCMMAQVGRWPAAAGNSVSKVPLYCNEGYVGPSRVVGVEWYDGLMGLPEPGCPQLAVCLDNGRLQLQRHEADEGAVCVDTGIKPIRVKWNCNGTVLAVAGYQLAGGGAGADTREVWMVQVRKERWREGVGTGHRCTERQPVCRTHCTWLTGGTSTTTPACESRSLAVLQLFG